MRLVLATRNMDKVKEMREALAGLPFEVTSLEAFPQVGEIPEASETLEENALTKAETVAAETGLPALADDTGLEVEELGGRPGVYSSRYAGEGASYEDNVRKLLMELDGVPPERRGALFRTVIALALPGERSRVVEGKCKGRILAAPRGVSGFGYDPVFTPEGFDRTFAEMTLSEKNAISHRGLALAAARAVLEEIARGRRRDADALG
jgi:XTP/dITP diphosphohydrolase